MRILTISNVPLLSHLGSGYVISGYVARLRAAGHQVDTLAPCDYEVFPRLRAAKRLRMLVGYSVAVSRALRNTAYDLVELWGGESWWIARRLARRAVRPLLVGRSNGIEPFLEETLRGAGVAARGSLAARVFNRWQRTEDAFRAVDALTTVSLRDREFALARGYQPSDRILALENPLPDDWLGQTVVTERPPVLGFFGSWLPQKGVALLPPVFATILRKRPRWRARLVGVGELDPTAFFPPDVASRIDVVPFAMERERMRQLYHETAIVMMPSLFESFGLVAAEAMACGCALVAAPVGFAAGLRSGREALLVSEHSAGAWAQIVDALIDDETQRAGIALGGQARVQSLRWDQAVERLLEFYTRTAAARSAANRPLLPSCVY